MGHTTLELQVEKIGSRKSKSTLKSTFRLANPLRKVAKTAKLNLNRYWGIFSQLYANEKFNKTTENSSFAEEMEQNRINELLEAASSQNSLNSQYEASLSSPKSLNSDLPPIRGFVRQHRCCLHSAYSSTTSFASSSLSYYMDEDVIVDDISVRSLEI